MRRRPGLPGERSAKPWDRLRATLSAVLFSSLLLLVSPAACTQDSTGTEVTAADTASYSFWSRHNLARVASIGMVGGTLAYSAGVWWVNDYRPFHFYSAPWIEGLGVDKIGHLFTSYAMFRALHETLLWGGHPPASSFWWAAGVSAFHGLAVEIGDGFSSYGFDYRDVTFNYAGLLYGMAQERVPFLKNFDLKWSLYYPMRHRSFKLNGLYDYHIYWITANVENLLPPDVRPYWPDFLQVAFGLGADDNVTRRTYVLSFDYNLETIPVDGKDVNLLKKLLNMIHLPAPGVKFSKGHPPVYQLLLLN